MSKSQIMLRNVGITAEIEAFQGAERAWRFHLDHGIRLKKSSPLRWQFGELSPRSMKTGSWE